MSSWKGIASPPLPSPGTPQPRGAQAKKNGSPEGAPPLVRLSRLAAGGLYFGVPCTASVTTARVSEGASISRNV